MPDQLRKLERRHHFVAYGPEKLLNETRADPYEIAPTWDAPEVVREGRTCWEVLSSLLARQRLYSFMVRVNATATGSQVEIVPFTFNAESLTFDMDDGESGHIPANVSQLAINLTHDRTARPVIKSTSADVFDQVRFRGARKTSTATFSFIDETLAISWPAELETEYEAGASGDADYPANANEVAQRAYMNHRACSIDKFKPVNARFILAAPWNGTVGNGTDGLPAEGEEREGEGEDPSEPLMPTDAYLNRDEEEEEESEVPDREFLAPDNQRFGD